MSPETLGSLTLPSISISQLYPAFDERQSNRGGVPPEMDTDGPQRLPGLVEPSRLLYLEGIQGWVASRAVRSVEILEDSRSVDLETFC